LASVDSVISLVHPTVSGIGVITTDTAWVVFDREMDETTLAAGCYFITGPDFDTWTGPDLQIFHEAESTGSGSDDVLESPGYEGILQGAITFEQYSISSDVTVTGVLDVVGSGHLFRTRMVFTPTNRLASDTTYNVHISGDEDITDSLNTGISQRTVFDTVTSGTNLNSGLVSFDGGYLGNYDDIYHLAITTAGDTGTAKFTFFRESDPTSVYGPFKTKRGGVLLSDGVTVYFADGEFAVDDKWTVVTKERTIYTGNVLYPFLTGSGSIIELPTTTSTTVLGDIPTPATISADSDTFTVSSTTPSTTATNLEIPAGPYTMTATFNNTVNAATVQSGVNVSVVIQDVAGEEYAESLDADPSTSGSVLSIVINSGVLPRNSVVTVTLGSDIGDTSGNTLGSDYEWDFSTTYNPLYCSVRRMRLSIGNFIQYVPDDTINFAIYVASLMADEMTWNSSNSLDGYYEFARQQWACCKAEEILLMNTLGGAGNLKSKTLGDLKVEYNNSGDSIPALDRAIQCQMKWEGALQAGGRQVQKVGHVVKGDQDYDRPPIGRGWQHTRSLSGVSTPSANTRTKFQGYRRYFNTHAKGWWNKG